MRQIRNSIRSSLKERPPSTSPDPAINDDEKQETENLNDFDDNNQNGKNDINSDDPQKHGRARVNALNKKSRQLSIISIILTFYWILCMFFAISRLLTLESPSAAGTLYQQLLDFASFWGGVGSQFISITILFSWVWIKVKCKNHRDNFTVCYLCCMGEPDPDLKKQKSFSHVLHAMNDGNQTPKEFSFYYIPFYRFILLLII